MSGPAADVAIVEATSPRDLAAARALIVEYQSELGIDLEFQHISDELDQLGTIYGAPSGLLLLARLAEMPIGCIGVRRLDERTCEMKRLFVAPGGRGRGLGRVLAERAMTEARGMGYDVMRLDTLPSMHTAQALYASLGFRDVPAYCSNPVPGTRFLEARL